MVKYVYDAWGVCDTIVLDENAANIANLNPFRYRSNYLDTGLNLYYLKTRYYDPEICRFITIDDISYIAPDTINGLNLYAYCGNNPVNKYDPTGKFPWLLFAAAMLFTPIGGTVTQAVVSAVSYAGIAVASVFDDDIRKDMNAIGWNPLNNDASIASNANKVSFYRGAPMVMIDGLGGSFSVALIGLDKTSHKGNVDVLKHERGHNTQLMTMGLLKYGLFVGIPSPPKNGDNTPWELSASILGGSNLGSSIATSQDRANAMIYYACATTNNPMLWLINLHYIFVY